MEWGGCKLAHMHMIDMPMAPKHTLFLSIQFPIGQGEPEIAGFFRDCLLMAVIKSAELHTFPVVIPMSLSRDKNGTSRLFQQRTLLTTGICSPGMQKCRFEIRSSSCRTKQKSQKGISVPAVPSQELSVSGGNIWYSLIGIAQDCNKYLTWIMRLIDF